MFVACVCISFAGSRLRLESIVSRKDAKNAKVYCSRLRLEYIVPQRRKGRKVLTFSPSARKHCHAKAQRPQSIERETSNFSNAKRQTFQTLQTCNIKREASNVQHQTRSVKPFKPFYGMGAKFSQTTSQFPSLGKPGLGVSLPSQPVAIMATAVSKPPFPGRYTRKRASW